MTETPRYWRYYYRYQEQLAKTEMYLHDNKSDGGVRSSSTLPPSLNKKAHRMAADKCRVVKFSLGLSYVLSGLTIVGLSLYLIGSVS